LSFLTPFHRSIDVLFDDPIRLTSLYTSTIDGPTFSDHLKTLPPEARSQQQALRRLGKAIESFTIRECCRYCWFHRLMCLCKVTQPMCNVAPLPSPPISLPISFSIIMHPREFSRITNSGKLLGALSGAEIMISWTPQTAQRITELMAMYGDSLCVLYPH